MSDWIGLSFFVLFVVGAFVGLKIIAKPRKSTAEEFERNAAESASMLSASMNALNGILNPEAGRGQETVTQVKEGRFDKKKREGKANARKKNLDGAEG